MSQPASTSYFRRLLSRSVEKSAEFWIQTVLALLIAPGIIFAQVHFGVIRGDAIASSALWAALPTVGVALLYGGYLIFHSARALDSDASLLIEQLRADLAHAKDDLAARNNPRFGFSLRGRACRMRGKGAYLRFALSNLGATAIDETVVRLTELWPMPRALRDVVPVTLGMMHCAPRDALRGVTLRNGEPQYVDLAVDGGLDSSIALPLPQTLGHPIPFERREYVFHVVAAGRDVGAVPQGVKLSYDERGYASLTLISQHEYVAFLEALIKRPAEGAEAVT